MRVKYKENQQKSIIFFGYLAIYSSSNAIPKMAKYCMLLSAKNLNHNFPTKVSDLGTDLKNNSIYKYVHEVYRNLENNPIVLLSHTQ